MIPSFEFRSLYATPQDDLVNEVLIPGVRASRHIRCMSGYFNSRAFAALAPGLAGFISCSSGAFDLLLSPSIESLDRQMLSERSAPQKRSP